MASPAKSGNVLLTIYEKKTTRVDLYKPLREYVSRRISEKQAEDVENDLQSLDRMRNDLQQTSSAPLDARLDLLVRYFRSLCAMEPRIPVTGEKDAVNGITFTWSDAFKQSKKASQKSIHFEKAGVLFNIAAVQSQIALSADRTSATGLKQACNSFQASAGVLAFLRENVSTKVSASMGPSTVDISTECAAMLEKLMLAQAQECFLEKVIADGKPPSLCAKVSKQVGLYYEEASAHFNRQSLGQHLDKTWIAHVQLKAAQFNAEACRRLCLELHEKEEIAEEIARLQTAVDSLAAAKKSAKGLVAAPLMKAAKQLQENLKRDLERANKENNAIYLLRIPSSSSLSPIQSVSLVQSTPMQETLDPTKEKIFGRLVTAACAEAANRYSAMADELVSNHRARLNQQSEMTVEKLKVMNLGDFLLAQEGNLKVPDDLEREVEEVLVNGGLSGIRLKLEYLRERRMASQEMLIQTDELLQKEMQKDTQLQSLGMRWSMPQWTLKNLSDSLSNYAGKLKQALESDAKIEQDVRENSSTMAILERKPLVSVAPNPVMTLDGSLALETLKENQKQLETLAAQGAGLEEKLKDIKSKDDILSKVVTMSDPYDDLFKAELGKYDNICQEIVQNTEARRQLLLQIQEQKDKLCALQNIDDKKATFEESCKQIVSATAKFREMNETIKQGLKFYDDLLAAIRDQVRKQCTDYVTARDMECENVARDVQRTVAQHTYKDEENGLTHPPPVPERHAPFSGGGGGGLQVHPSHHTVPPTPYYYPVATASTGAGFVPPPYTAQPPPVLYQQPYAQYVPPPPPVPPPQAVPHPYAQPSYGGWQPPAYSGYHVSPQSPCPYGQPQYPPPPYGVHYYMNQ